MRAIKEHKSASSFRFLQKKASEVFNRFNSIDMILAGTGNLTIGELDDIKDQFFAYYIYNHRYEHIIRSIIAYRYLNAWRDLDRYIQPTINPLRKVANIKAKTYERPPIRRVKNVELQKVLSNNAKRFNSKLDYASKLLNATGNVCIWPVILTKKDEGFGGIIPAVFDLLVIPAHMTYVEPNYWDNKYDIVCKFGDYYLISYFDQEIVTRENIIVKVNKSTKKDVYFVEIGDPVWVGFQGCGFEKIRTVDNVRDLVNGTIDIGIMEAMASKVTYLKSFRQMVQTDSEKVNIDKLEASPNTLWPANVDTIDLADKDFGFETYIETKAINLAGNHGVSKVIYKGDFQGQESWNSVSEELLHHWEEQVELWHNIEIELWENLQKMSLLFTENTSIEKPTIRFQSPYPSMRDPRTEWELHREKVKHGIESTIERMMMEHPDILTEDEAAQKWRENLEKYAEEVNLYRSLNIQAYGASPQENGAIGAMSKAQAYGELGKNGPQVGGVEFQKTLLEEANNE